MIPAKIIKNPRILIDVDVGRATRIPQIIISDADKVMSIVERTLTNVFSI